MKIRHLVQDMLRTDTDMMITGPYKNMQLYQVNMASALRLMALNNETLELGMRNFV